MGDVGEAERIVVQARAELADELCERVRRRLSEQPAEWLVDQLLRLLLPESSPPGAPDGPGRGATGRAGGVSPASSDPHPVVEANGAACAAAVGVPRQRAAPQAEAAAEPLEEEADRAARAARVRALAIDTAKLPDINERYRALDRGALVRQGLLIDPPPQGGPLIAPRHRSERGAALLCEAKDVLYALLFGDEREGVRIERLQRELLTLTVPRAKLHAIAFVLRAATEIGVRGTWRDPQGAAHDEHAANTLLQVEYGEAADAMAGTAIAACLRLINELEINERMLHGRVENVEESTR